MGDGDVEMREISDELRVSYLDYAMSVIVGRALPDVRDGLKPVHRRVLYAMHDLGLQPNRSYVKCAKVVGETMGEYHPHGDTAIYDTLVRLAQPFSSRHPLVDGQGNFGSIDGYAAAAMRYTECRLAPVALQMLRDLDADTVDFGPNYDGRTTQPLVLPARFPNLLVNGGSGIAVGMATNIPPHNLGEAIDAVVAYIDDPQIEVEGLMAHLPGPDFPTGGIVMGTSGIREAYETGRGRIRLRAKTEIEELSNGRTAIIVSELPFTVRKGGEEGVIAKIAQLANDKVVTEIADIRDESSERAGMRIVILLKRDANVVPTAVLNKLFKHSPLQTTFGANMVALVDNVPRTLGLRDLIRHYVDHQREVVTRRTKHQLARAERRAHILEGYLVAIDNLDEVIALIRASASPQEAREGLMARFGLSEEQAQAILDMRLQALTGLERDRVRDEHAQLTARIAELRAILADEGRVYQIVKDELLEVKAEFADARRTEITAVDGEIDHEAMIADEPMVVTVTSTGYVKRVPLELYRQQRRGGVGVRGAQMRDDDDWLEHLVVSSAHEYLLFFSSRGKVYRLKTWQLPLGQRDSKGRAVVNLLPLEDDERVTAVIQTRDYSEGRYVVFGTKLGVVKKTDFSAYEQINQNGKIALVIRDEDELISVRLCDPDDRVMMVSRLGMAVRFKESDVRAMGRVASGVTGMRLRAGDEVIALRVPEEGDDLLVVTEAGFRQAHAGRRVPRDRARRPGREDDPVHRRRPRRAARGGARHERRRRRDGDDGARHRHPHGRRGDPPDRPLHAGRPDPERAGRRERPRRDRRARARAGGQRRGRRRRPRGRLAPAAGRRGRLRRRLSEALALRRGRAPGARRGRAGAARPRRPRAASGR